MTAGAGFQFLSVPLEASLVHALNARINGAALEHLIGAEYQGSSTTMRQTVLTLGGVWVY